MDQPPELLPTDTHVIRTLACEDAQYIRYVQVAALYVTGSASTLLARKCPFQTGVRYGQVPAKAYFNECIRSLSQWLVFPHVALQAQVGSTAQNNT